MAIEIEAKFQLDETQSLEAKLAAVGATRGHTVIERNTYFDTPQGSLAGQGGGLRLRVERQEGGPQQKNIITYKGPLMPGKFKSRQEIEVQVNDADTAVQLLNALGYVARLSFEKRRGKWELDGCEVVIDTLPHLGHFTEIEGPSEQAVQAVRGKLGLEGLEVIRRGYASLLAQYAQDHRLGDAHFTLDS